jgi:hypothetical protein
MRFFMSTLLVFWSQVCFIVGKYCESTSNSNLAITPTDGSGPQISWIIIPPCPITFRLENVIPVFIHVDH